MYKSNQKSICEEKKIPVSVQPVHLEPKQLYVKRSFGKFKSYIFYAPMGFSWVLFWRNPRGGGSTIRAE